MCLACAWLLSFPRAPGVSVLRQPGSFRRPNPVFEQDACRAPLAASFWLVAAKFDFMGWIEFVRSGFNIADNCPPNLFNATTHYSCGIWEFSRGGALYCLRLFLIRKAHLGSHLLSCPVVRRVLHLLFLFLWGEGRSLLAK